MSDNKVIDNKVKRMVRLISNWCIDNHAPDFCCAFQLTGHVDWVEIELHSGGHNHPVGIFKPEWVSLDNKYSFKWLCELYAEMKEFKESHDYNFSEEHQAQIKEKKRLDEIERLKSRLASLED